ncbi:MAG: Rrf2 family transcriptional regulator [Lachnospiraceae bacterium]|nr:Rrf2 family transcriptional regulator [Lachnospiraceae bacterium]
MKISTKGRYALRLMIDITMHGNGAPVPVKDIAARQEISVKYLEQIISSLVRAGLLNSIRGPQGGYRLTRQPSEYTVGEILRQTEGCLIPVECLNPNSGTCSRESTCVTQRFWRELNDAINSVVDKYTLEDFRSWTINEADNYII